MKVAIVGFGYAGAVVLDRLIASCPKTTEFVMFDQNDSRGEGRAFQKDSDLCRLNRPAELMFFRHKGDFQSAHSLRWDEFVPRHLFGTFVRNEVEELLRAHRHRISVIGDTVTRICREGGGYRIVAASGSTIRADAVVLAVGSTPRDLPYGLENASAYVHEAYPVQAVAKKVGRRVAIIGCRHSAVDVALTLLDADASRHVLMASRHSQLPRSTDAYQRLPLRTTTPDKLASEILAAGGGLKSAARVVNRELKSWGIDESLLRLMAARTSTPDNSSTALIYGVISSMNRELAEIWNMMADSQRRDFKARWQTLWSDFRVPLPRISGDAIHRYAAQGRLTHLSGIAGVRRSPADFALEFTDGSSHIVDSIVNAAGPCTEVSGGLLQALLEDGLVTSDPMGGVGIEFQTNLAVTGRRTDRIYVVGHLSNGSYFGVGSIDAIHDQVSKVSGSLASGIYDANQPDFAQPAPARAVA